MSQYLQLLGGRPASAGELPPGFGPAPSGQPYPTPPQAGTGSSILYQRLDPTTTMLSNIPPTAPATPPPQAAQAAAALGALRQFPTTFQPTSGSADAATVAQWRHDYRTLSGLLHQDAKDKRLAAMGGTYVSPESLSLVNRLIEQGAITVTPNDFDTGMQFPGGHQARQQLIRVIDYWRDMQAAAPQ